MSGRTLPCIHCDDTGWVCENHLSRPWGGFSKRRDACQCGAEAPCRVCNPRGKEARAGSLDKPTLTV